MARVFVRLKLRLLRNGLRGNWQQTFGLVAGILVAVPLAAGGFALLALLPRSSPELGPAVAVTAFVAVFLAWTFLPVLTFAADATLDPARLALLPLRPRQLITGLFVASCIGIAPALTLVVLAGAVAGYAPPGPGAVLVVAAVLVEFVLCVAMARALTTALSRWLRTRKARDLAVLVGGTGALAFNLMVQAAVRLTRPAGTDELAGALRPVARVAGWLPPGLAARAVVGAGQGDLAGAAGELLLAALAALLLLWWWYRSLAHVLTTAEPAARPPRRAAGGLVPRFARPLLPADACGAVAAKELRYMVRHPRLRVFWLLNCLFVIAMIVFAVLVDAARRPELVLLALALLYVSSANALNQFGADGAAWWTNLAAGVQPRAELIGRNLATAIAGMALVVAVAVPFAALTGGWLYLPVVLCVGVGMLGVMLAVADFVSVRYPVPVPEVSTNLWATQGVGQGCTTGLVQAAAVMAQGTLLVPIAVLVGVGVLLWRPALAIACPFAVGYGLGLWWAGVRVGGDWLRDHQPELLAALRPTRAA
jgi:ABC-2 type transport system permease protein